MCLHFQMTEKSLKWSNILCCAKIVWNSDFSICNSDVCEDSFIGTWPPPVFSVSSARFRRRLRQSRRVHPGAGQLCWDLKFSVDSFLFFCICPFSNLGRGRKVGKGTRGKKLQNLEFYLRIENYCINMSQRALKKQNQYVHTYIFLLRFLIVGVPW